MMKRMYCLLALAWLFHAGAAAQVTRLKVMSYNMRIASPPSMNWNGTDLAAIARVINAVQPDLVALQEVDAFTERSGKTSHQAKELAALTGMHYFFAKAVNRSGGDYGVAVLSRFPIIKSEARRLQPRPGSEGETRGLAFITVNVPGSGRIGFLCAHLDHLSDEDRAAQLQQLFALSDRYRKIPLVLGADLNMTPENALMAQFKGRFTVGCSSCPLTFPQDTPRQTIDYIMLSPRAAKRFRIASYATVSEPYASDHLPLVAELEPLK